MRSSNFNYTLGDLEYFSNSPRYSTSFARIKVSEGQCTYEEFLDLLYTDLSRIFDSISETAHKRQKDDEDRITTDILIPMKQLGWKAYHEANNNGKVDITIDSGFYKWLGEAKIDHSVQNLLKGFKQLFDRYTTGVNYSSIYSRGENATECGILFYVKNNDNYQNLKTKWKESIEKYCTTEGYKVEFEDENEIYTYSTHKHPKSGLYFRIKYLPLLLYFNPKDR